jgi:hypothetical protein
MSGVVDARVLDFISYFFLESCYTNKKDRIVSCYGKEKEHEYELLRVLPKSYLMKDPRNVAVLAEKAKQLELMVKSGEIPSYIELTLCLEAYTKER